MERGGGGERGVRGGVLGWRRRSAVMREIEERRVTKRAGEKTEGDDEEEGNRRVEVVFHPLTRSF